MLRDLLVKVPNLHKEVMKGVAGDPLIGEIGVVVEVTGETEVVVKDIEVEIGTPLGGSPEGDHPEEGVTAKETMITKSRVFSEG